MRDREQQPARSSVRAPRRIAATIVIGLAVLLLSPSLVPVDPFTQRLDEDLRGPSWPHPCGQDKLGRDVLARLLVGARVSLGIGLVVVATSASGGLLLGGLAGSLGGRADRVIMGVIDVLLAFPGILLALAVVAIRGPGVANVVLSLALLGWPGYARLVRGQILTLRERDYVVAARALGASSWRVAIRHLLPALAGLLAVQATFGVAGAIVAEGGLSFLGLGVPPPLPSWGAMLADGRTYVLVAPHLTIFPALAIMLTVLAVNLLGDRLRDRLDPTIRARAA